MCKRSVECVNPMLAFEWPDLESCAAVCNALEPTGALAGSASYDVHVQSACVASFFAFNL